MGGKSRVVTGNYPLWQNSSVCDILRQALLEKSTLCPINMRYSGRERRVNQGKKMVARVGIEPTTRGFSVRLFYAVLLNNYCIIDTLYAICV